MKDTPGKEEDIIEYLAAKKNMQVWEKLLTLGKRYYQMGEI